MRKLSQITALLMSIFFTEQAAQAATYYVSTTGNDSNTGTELQPFRTIAKGVSVMSAGDTLNIRGGTYAERINSGTQNLPIGTSFSNAPVIQGYSGEAAIIKPQAGEVITLENPSVQYIIFKDLIVDATGVEFGIGITNGAHHIRFQNVEIKNAIKSGVLTTPGSQPYPADTYLEFLSCSSHDNGSTANQDHGFYISTSSNLIRKSKSYNNAAYGFHIYNGNYPSQTAQNNIVTESQAYNNSTGSASSAGILLSGGAGNKAFNNIVYGNKHGIGVDYYSNGAKIYNNTIYNNTPGYAVTMGVSSTASNTDIRNNIFWQNGGDIINNGGGASGTTSSNNLATNPYFQNAAAGNFQLQSGSPAVDQGLALSDVPNDFVGTLRPQLKAYDIGAYEYAVTDNIPPDAPKGLKVQ